MDTLKIKFSINDKYQRPIHKNIKSLADRRK